MKGTDDIIIPITEGLKPNTANSNNGIKIMVAIKPITPKQYVM